MVALPRGALQFQTPNPTVTIERSGSTYTFVRDLGLGREWRIDLAEQTTNGTTAHVLTNSRITGGASTATLYSGTSVFEYAVRCNPTGGTLTWLGNGHGYDDQTAMTIKVDGSTVTVSDAGSESGETITVTRTSTLTHPDAATVGTATTVYTLTGDGLDVSVTIVWSDVLTVGTAYLGMMPCASTVDKGKVVSQSPSALTTDDDSVPVSGTALAGWLWETSGDHGALLTHLDEGRSLEVTDRSDGVNKVYTRRSDLTETADGDEWTASFRYVGEHFDGGADNSLASA